jgi:peptide/nickel transport system permease protein
MMGPASRAHLLGTDFLGRDVLSRLLDGTRFTVGLAFIAALLACFVGGALGMLSGLCGRWVSEPVGSVVDAIISIPSKMLALVMVSVFGSSVWLLVITAVVAYFPGAYRISRSLAMGIVQMEYVQVARSRGEGRLYIAAVEMLPNMALPMLTDFGMRFVFIVLLLSGMSFLGLGIQPPAADLGSLVKENISGLTQGSLAVLAPAIAIGSITIGVNLLLDALGSKRR